MNINFGEIADSIMDALDHYDIPYKPAVIQDNIVPAWYRAKKPLLELFSRHPNWNDKAVSILFDTKYERDINIGGARDAFLGLAGAVGDPVIDPPDYHNKISTIYGCFPYSTHKFSTAKITKENQEEWLEVCPSDKEATRFFPVGLRTSRAFDRFFKYYGKDKHPAYNKLFAVLADAVSPLEVTRTTCLSFHPCDYLFMSRGTGWHSCHLINGGGWQGGTWSYMLDNVSSIFYTTEDTDDDMYWRTKINRMVMCFQDKEILFSRLYPCSGDTELRKTFRQVVQEIYAQCLGIPNAWQRPMGEKRYSGHHKDDWGRWVWDSDKQLIFSGEGHMQYEDYNYADFRPELSVAKGAEPTPMYIGTYGICPVSGEQYRDHRRMVSKNVTCRNCGCVVNEDDALYDEDGNLYCRSCWNEIFAECEQCGRVHRRYDMWETENGGYVCNHCFRESYHLCTCCNRAVHYDDAVVDVYEDIWCSRCANRHLVYCDNCDEYYPGHMVRIFDRDSSFRNLCDDCYAVAMEELTEEVEANA